MTREEFVEFLREEVRIHRPHLSEAEVAFLAEMVDAMCRTDGERRTFLAEYASGTLPTFKDWSARARG